MEKKKNRRFTKVFLAISGVVAFLASLFQILDVNLPSLIKQFTATGIVVDPAETKPTVEAKASPYVTIIRKRNSFIELLGHFPNEKTEDIIVEDLQKQGLRVSDIKVTYAEGQPKGYILALISPIPILSYFEDAEIELSDLTVSIKGKTNNWKTYYNILDEFPNLLPEGFDANLVSVLEPYPCQKQIDIILSQGAKVQFAYDRAEIVGSRSSQFLEQMAERLRFCGAVRLKVIAHSGPEGAEDYNLKLSQARAEEITRRLVSLGVGSASIQSIGYGEKNGYSQPKLEFITNR